MSITELTLSFSGIKVYHLGTSTRLLGLRHTRVMPTRQELRALARLRLKEAEVLFDALSGLKGKIVPEAIHLFRNWATTVPWKPDLRYSPPGTVTRTEALEILDAIRDPENGVLRWIKSYW